MFLLGRRDQVRKERGQSLTEFALILPVLVLLVMAILDFGRAVYAYSVVANAAREGARFAAVSPNDSVGAVAATTAAAIGLEPSRLTVTFSRPDSSTVRVLVSYGFELITPLISNVVGSQGLTLRSSATMYVGY